VVSRFQAQHETDLVKRFTGYCYFVLFDPVFGYKEAVHRTPVLP